MNRKVAVQWVGLFAATAILMGQNCAALPGGGAGNLVDVWQGGFNDPTVGPTRVDLVLLADGTFTESYTSATTLTYISRGYSVDVGMQGLLRLTVLDYFPKDFLGTKIQPIAGGSWLYSFIENNNLVLTNADCQNLNQPGFVINHQRINWRGVSLVNSPQLMIKQAPDLFAERKVSACG